MKKARSQKLKKFNKVLSVLLAAAMVAGSVPDVSLVAHATEAETEAAEETNFLSEENVDTTDSDAADAVSESTSEEVSTAEEQQQPSEEAVPTEEEVSEEAVSTQEASSTEENKESEPTSDAVETESVNVSEDNTAGEEETAVSEETSTEQEATEEEVTEDEELNLLADSAYKLQKIDPMPANITTVKYLSSENEPTDFNANTEGGSWKDAASIEDGGDNTGEITAGHDLYIYVVTETGYHLKTETGKIDALDGHEGYYKVTVADTDLSEESGNKTYTLTLEAEADEATSAPKISLNVTDTDNKLTAVHYGWVADADTTTAGTAWEKTESTYNDITLSDQNNKYFVLKLTVDTGYTATVTAGGTPKSPEADGITYKIGEITADTVISVTVAAEEAPEYEPKQVTVKVMDGTTEAGLDTVTVDFDSSVAQDADGNNITIDKTDISFTAVPVDAEKCIASVTCADSENTNVTVTEEDGTYTITNSGNEITNDITITITLKDKSYVTVAEDITEDGSATIVYEGDNQPDEATKKVEAGKDIVFTVNPADEKLIDKVEYQVGAEGTKTVISPVNEKYTISASVTAELEPAEDNTLPVVTIFVTTKDKTYSVTLKAEESDKANIGTIKYLAQASTAAAPTTLDELTETATIGTAIDTLKKGQTIYFVVPEAADKDEDERIDIEVSYSVPGEGEDSEPEKKIIEPDANGIYKYEADTAVSERDINVSAKRYTEKEITFAAGTRDAVTIKYIKADGNVNAEASAYTPVDLSETAEPLKFDAGEKYYLLITPTAEKTSVKNVTLTTADSTTASVAAVNTAAGKVYEVTVGAEDTKDEIAVEVATTVHFDFPTDANIDGLKYSFTDSANDADYVAVPAEGLDIAQGEKIYLKVKVKENSELIATNPVAIEHVSKAAAGDEPEEITSDNAKSGTNGNYIITGDATITNGDETKPVTNYTVCIYARRQTYQFTLVWSGDAAIVSSTDDSIIVSATSAITSASGDSATITQFKGTTYKVKLNPAEGKRNAVLKNATSEDGEYKFGVPCEEIEGINGTYDEYSISSVHDKQFIRPIATPIPTYDVTVSKAEGLKSITPLKADGTDDTPISFTTAENITLKTGVTEGGNISFKINLEENTNYILDKVTAGGKTLTADETTGAYTLSNITAENCAISITTKLNPEKANSFAVTTDDTAKVTITAPESGAYTEKVYTMSKTFSFKVDVLDGYQLKTDEEGEVIEAGITADNAMLAKAGDGYTATIAADTARADVTITIVTEPKKAANDKYIKLDVDENCDVTIKTSGINAVEGKDGIYKVPENSTEVEFEVVVPQDYKAVVSETDAVEAFRQIGEAKKSGSGINAIWTYNYKIAVGAFGAEAYKTEETPYTLEIHADSRDITVSLTNDSAAANMIKVNGELKDNLNAGESLAVNYGDTVIIGLKPGQELYKSVDGEKEESSLNGELDDYKKYRFEVTEEENEFAITQAAADYKVVEHTSKNEISSTVLDYADNKTVELGIVAKNDIDTLLDIKEAKIVYEDGAPAVEGTTAVIDTEDKTKLIVTASGKDAGKSFAVELYTIKTITTEAGQQKTKKVLAGVVNVTIKETASNITIKGVKNNQTLKLQADITTGYDITTNPANLDTLLAASAKVITDGAATTTDAKVQVGFANGKMQITTPKKEELAEVKVYSKADPEKILLTFKVQTTLAKPELAKIESPVQGFSNIVLTLTPNANVNKLNYNNLYYEVTVNAQSGTAPTNSLTNKTFYFKKNNGEASITKSIIVNTVSDPFKAETKWKYDFTARMVIVKDGVTVTTDTAGAKLSDDSIVAFGKDKVKTFETRNAYYEDKLGVTKKTTKIFSGQQDVLAAVVKYSKNASHLTIDEDDIVVLNSNNVAVDNVTTQVDNKTNEVYVSVDAGTIPGKYNVVLYAEAERDDTNQTMYQATATIPITVVYGIESIDASVPAQVTVLGNKAASITVKPTGYRYDTSARSWKKAASQKFTYELLTVDDKSLTIYGNEQLKSHVSIKNNKVTIAKGFKAGYDAEDNTFIIRVRANDYTGNDYYEDFPVEITNEYLELGKIYLAKGPNSNKELTAATAKDADWSYVVVLDKNGKVVDGSLYTVTGNKNLNPKREDNEWLVNVNGAAKNVQLKATTVDGGKKTIKSDKKYTFGYITPAAFTTTIKEDTNVTLVDTGANEFTFKGNAASRIVFNIQAKDEADDSFGNAYPAYYNYTVAVKNGKLVKDYYGSGSSYTYALYPNPDKDTVTVTITDKTKRNNNKTEIKFINKTPITAAAPKASTKDKLYGRMTPLEPNMVRRSLMNYTFNSRVEYEAVLLSYDSGCKIGMTDPTVPSSSEWKDIILPVTSLGSGKYEFTLGAHSNDATGTAKYKIVYGHIEIDNGVKQFIAETKPAALNIKINKLTDFKPQTSYTITPAVSSSVALTGKPANVIHAFTEIQNANVKGRANGFRNWFELNGSDLKLKSTVTPTQIANVGKEGGIPKEDLTGYVKYQYNIGNGVVEKTAKITVKLDTKAKKYKADTAVVLGVAQTEAKTRIMNGKLPVSVAKAYADSTTWSVANAGIVDGTSITLNASNPSAEKHVVSLYIVEPNSQYLGEVTNLEKAKTYGTKVDVTIDVKDKAAYDKKLTFNKKALTIDLNKYKEDQSISVVWNDTADVKSVQWTIARATGNGDFAVIASDTLASAAVTDTELKGITALASENSITLSVNKKDVLDKLNKTIKVPVELTFANGTVKETITFTVKTPKTLPGLEVAKTAVDNYLKKAATTGSEAGDKTKYSEALFTQILGNAGKEVALSGAKVKAVTVTAMPPAAAKQNYTSKVSVTLEDQANAESTLTTEAELLMPTAVVDYTAAKAKVLEKLGTYVSEKANVTDGKTLATDALTVYEIRSFCQQAISNDKYIVGVEVTDRQEATKENFGTISIRFWLVDRDNLTDEDYENTTYEIKTAKIEDSTTPPETPQP